MPQVSAAVLRSAPSSTSASASIRRAAAPSFSPLAALRSSEAVRSSRVIDTAAPIDAAPLKSQHRVRVSLIWESLMSHSFGPLVLDVVYYFFFLPLAEAQDGRVNFLSSTLSFAAFTLSASTAFFNLKYSASDMVFFIATSPSWR